MNRLLLAVGVISICIVAVLAFTCPDEEEFSRYLEKEQGLICEDTSFACERGGEKLTLTSTSIRNGVFFMTGEKTLEGEQSGTVVIRSVGLLHRFFGTTIETLD